MKYFKESEVTCKCNKCNMTITDDLKILLDKLREGINMPLTINSGARCNTHNKNVGASPTSSHIKGVAVDIRAINDLTKAKIIHYATRLGIARIGIAKTFIHLDIDKDKSPAIWDY